MQLLILIVFNGICMWSLFQLNIAAFALRSIYVNFSLQMAAFGGNELSDVPTTLGHLYQLQALVLCDNKLESLPANIANLHKLKSLLLHKNKLKTLPPEIVALKNLTEVSYIVWRLCLSDNGIVRLKISFVLHAYVQIYE